MPKLKLIVEYDGKAFHGWQQQLRVPTVQGELARVIPLIARVPLLWIHSSGRTDAGVHARGQVVCIELPELAIEPEKLARGISAQLRGKLTVHSIKIVADDFHPQHQAIAKEYRYRILLQRNPPVLEKGKVWHIPPSPLDISKLYHESKALVGVHDFKALSLPEPGQDTQRRILISEWTQNQQLLEYRIVGNGFLRYMVRIIVGTLVYQARGNIRSSITEIIASKNRSMAGITAPAHGLYLWSVTYRDIQEGALFEGGSDQPASVGGC